MTKGGEKMHVNALAQGLQVFWGNPADWTLRRLRQAFQASRIVRSLRKVGRQALTVGKRAKLMNELNALCGPKGLGFFR
ncbi:MAG: hypothetical protein AAB647_02760 [Patescibacteria group bacterium]